LVFQPPPLRMTLTLGDGQTRSYRAIPPMLEDGILLDQCVDSLQDFERLMRSGDRRGNPIRKIRLDESPGLRGFERSIRIVNTWYMRAPEEAPEPSQ
jgi:hypothetical protein